jgi:tripartite-type tricarboxylate transporter receptor subunit TctC
MAISTRRYADLSCLFHFRVSCSKGGDDAPDVLVRCNRVQGGPGCIPGTLNYGHQGPLSIPHLAMEELLLTANVDITSVPFRGDPLVITELLGGRIEVASLVLGAISGQNLDVIGIFSDARHGSYPGVPTVREQGYDVNSESFGGLLVPLGTPAPVIGRLAAACAGAAQDDAYVNAAKASAQPAAYFADAATFSLRLKRDIEGKTRVLARVMK